MKILILITFFAVLSVAHAGENLLVNPGFENVDPIGWAAYGNSVYYTGTCRSGKQSGKTWVWDYGDGLFEQYVDVVPGEKYKASVYILSKADDPVKSGDEAWIQIEWCTHYNVVISDPIKSPSLKGFSSSWELFSTPEVIAPFNAAKAKIKLIMQSSVKDAEGSCYFDDADFSVVPFTMVMVTEYN